MWFGFGFGIKCIKKWKKKYVRFLFDAQKHRKYRKNDDFSFFFAVALHLAYSIMSWLAAVRAIVVVINRFPNGLRNSDAIKGNAKFKLFTIMRVSGEIAL